MFATQNASRGRCQFLERRRSLAEFVECGCRVLVTLLSANNCALTLIELRRYAEATSLLLKMTPVARRVLGESDETTLKMRWSYAEALRKDDGATLGDLRESVETLEDTLRIARRTLGSAHPLTAGLVGELPRSRAALRARDFTPSTSA